MQIFRYLLILTIAFSISTASAQNYDLPILEHVYENGLRLLVIERPGEDRRRLTNQDLTAAVCYAPSAFGRKQPLKSPDIRSGECPVYPESSRSDARIRIELRGCF